MLKLLIAAALTLFLIDLVLPNVSISSPVILLITSVVLSLVQSIIKPILSLLLLPLTIITFGLFNTIIQILLLWLVTAVVPGFHIDPMMIAGIGIGYFTTLILVGFFITWGQKLVVLLLNRLW